MLKFSLSITRTYISPRDIICNILSFLNIKYFKIYMRINNIKNCLLNM